MKNTEKEFRRYLKCAQEAALLAGKFLASLKRQDIIVTHDKGRDIKISADKEAEDIIIRALRKKNPFTIISEEKGRLKGKGNHFQWVIDPLDGSYNFLRGIPQGCVSIALVDNQRPVVGVIYDFYRKEMFYGIHKVGAWLNGKRIVVSNTSEIKNGVLLTGFPVKLDFSPKNLKKYLNLIRIFKKVRLFGSAALSLAYVACGRADAYFEKDILSWDVAAGLVIVSGAKGEYLVNRTKENIWTVFASNPYLGSESKKFLTP